MLDARGEELSRLKSIKLRLNYIHALRTLHFTLRSTEQRQPTEFFGKKLLSLSDTHTSLNSISFFFVELKTPFIARNSISNSVQSLLFILFGCSRTNTICSGHSSKLHFYCSCFTNAASPPPGHDSSRIRHSSAENVQLNKSCGLFNHVEAIKSIDANAHHFHFTRQSAVGFIKIADQ